MSIRQGLYAITPTHLDADLLLHQVEQVILGGAQMIQYRDKSKDHTRREFTARRLLKLCHQHQCPLIINDDIALAKTIGANGVHLGIEDSSIAQARTLLGDHAIIGISCYNDIKLAKQAVTQGANYVAFGRFFVSQTKPNASLATIETLQLAKKIIPIPIVAIGGITINNGHTLIAAGANILAVVNEIFAADDIQETTRKMVHVTTQKTAGIF